MNDRFDDKVENKDGIKQNAGNKSFKIDEKTGALKAEGKGVEENSLKNLASKAGDFIKQEKEPKEPEADVQESRSMKAGS